MSTKSFAKGKNLQKDNNIDILKKNTLYSTLCKNIPKKDLTKKQKEFIKESITRFDEFQTEAMLMLIVADAIIHDNYVPSNIDLPYHGIFDQETGGPKFLIEECPQRLRWVLHKFSEMENKKLNI